MKFCDLFSSPRLLTCIQPLLLLLVDLGEGQMYQFEGNLVMAMLIAITILQNAANELMHVICLSLMDFCKSW